MKKVNKINILVFIVVLLSCNNSQHQSEEYRNNMLEHKVNNLIGLWFITSEEINKMVYSYNVCPEIEFFEDGIGKIIKPSKEEISFTYILSLDSNRIEFSFETYQQYFYEKEYLYKIYTECNLYDLEILEISSNDGKSKYILSREKITTGVRDEKSK